MSENKIKKIAVNTLIVYLRVFISIIVSLIATRYVLMALGQEQYGLFNVVGSIVTMLNVISVGMYTTTRRFLNVEMGKSNSNVNKVFNISLRIHIAFAISVYLIALTIGLWYIYNILNVSEKLFSDALFVFFTTTTVSAIGIINIPFQGLLSAFEEFGTIAKVEISAILLRLPLVLILFIWPDISLRLYATGLSLISLLSSVLYYSYCRVKHYEIIKLNRYKDKTLYKSILIFNNYTSLGALGYISRSQGARMIINYFFGTMVNGAFAIVYQIEETFITLVNNLSVASDPQIIQSYSSGEKVHAFSMVRRISKYTMLVMLGLVFCFMIEFEFLIKLWLGKIPNGVMEPLIAIMIGLFVRSINSSCGTLVQASGKLKYFEISNTIFAIIGIPISILLFYFGFEPYVIVVVYTILDFLSRISYLLLMRKYINFRILQYFKESILPVMLIFILLVIYYRTYKFLNPFMESEKIIGIVISFFFYLIVTYIFALSSSERKSLKSLLLGY